MSRDEDIPSIKALLLRWISDEELNATEQVRLQHWAEASPDNQLLLDQLKDDGWLMKEVGKMRGVDTEGNWQAVVKKLHPVAEPVERPVRRMSGWKPLRIAAAAVLLIIAGLGLGKWWFRSSQPAGISSDPLLTPEEMAAAGAATQVSLTLQDGSVIVLDDNANQQLPPQAGARIKLEEGRRLVYNRTASPGTTTTDNQSSKESYNTLTIPRGQQFELVLTDGTRIWLNNASSLRYPVTFTGRERDLQLTGEAYFEVAQIAGLPFRVQTPSIQTDVLGTHFNVRDYPNELAPRTTLLQGKVIVRKGKEAAMLDTPGEEAQTIKGVTALQVTPVDVGSRVAWKSGDFYFDSLDIRSSLREVARWYRKDLRFEGGAEKAQLAGGETKRDQPLVKLLKHLERGDLHFQVRDSIIIVSR
ncbi:MAG TPA: FecR family protein [Puia sp.]|nr:FecR family protein [Puia sp.]